MEDVKILETQEFEVEIYGQTIEVCNVNFEDPETNARVLCSEKTNGRLRLMLDLSKINASIIVHEAVHIAIFICEKLGLYFDTDKHEHFAYLVEFIFDKIVEIVEEMRKNHENIKP